MSSRTFSSNLPTQKWQSTDLKAGHLQLKHIRQEELIQWYFDIRV